MPRIPPGPQSGPPPKGKSEKECFLAAERQQESGGNYQIVNPNSGALGAWQVMPYNVNPWLAQCGHGPESSYQFLHDPAAQNLVAWCVLGGYYDRYGPDGAAAMWYSGQPDPTKTYGDPPVYVYVQDVISLMQKCDFTINLGPAPGGAAFNLPPPNENDWSGTILAGARYNVNAAARVSSYARGIRLLY